MFKFFLQKNPQRVNSREEISVKFFLMEFPHIVPLWGITGVEFNLPCGASGRLLTQTHCLPRDMQQGRACALKSCASARALVSGILLPHCTLPNPWQHGSIEPALPGTCHVHSSCQDSWGVLCEKPSAMKICGATDNVHLPSPRSIQSSAFLELIPDLRLSLCNTQHDEVLQAIKQFILQDWPHCKEQMLEEVTPYYQESD